MPATTLYRKLVDSHTVERLDADNVLLYADLHIMNEYTSPQAFAGLAQRGLRVRRPRQQLGVVDHVIPTRPVPIAARTIDIAPAARQAANFAANCAEQGIELFDVRDPMQGIEHVVAPELGLIRPGMVVLCGDSHTTTYGALGALGFGIGTSEVEHVLATQTLVYRVAKDMRIQVDGRLPLGTTSKDLILHIIAKIGAQGARGYAVEYVGEAITALSAEARMTLCNMTVEAGARAALIAPDAITSDYVSERICDMDDAALAAAHTAWKQLRTDASARFDAEHRFDASEVAPYVTWGTSPDQAVPVDGTVPPLSDAAGDIERATWRKARITSAWRPARRSKVFRSTACSSVRVPTPASRTCARQLGWCGGARLPQACGRWWCLAPGWFVTRPNAKGSRRCWSRRDSNGGNRAVRCAWR